MQYHDTNYPNLVFTQESKVPLTTHPALIQDAAAVRKVTKGLTVLDIFGTNNQYHPKGNLENLGSGWWSLRIRCGSNFWRIMFRKIPNSQKYGLILMFLKKGNKISSQEWAASQNAAKREGWL